MTKETEGWEAYSKLVLKELETLSSGIEMLKHQLVDVKQEIAEIKSREDRIHGLVTWKERVDEIISPTQLKELKTEVDQLKLFKTKAVTIFMVVQFGTGLILALMNFL
jgi:hypothetical protein